jgi:hypothetical protein
MKEIRCSSERRGDAGDSTTNRRQQDFDRIQLYTVRTKVRLGRHVKAVRWSSTIGGVQAMWLWYQRLYVIRPENELNDFSLGCDAIGFK